jgi:hypothetical protein
MHPTPNSSEAGEATYAVMIRPGEEILTGDGRTLRVLDVVPIDEENSPFVGKGKARSAAERASWVAHVEWSAVDGLRASLDVVHCAGEDRSL